jgi:uncharacterized membrane protein YczE
MLMRAYYAHYLIPLIMLSPVLWLELRRDLKRGFNGEQSKTIWLGLGLAVLACGITIGLADPFKSMPRDELAQIQQSIGNQFGLTKDLPWKNYAGLLIGASLAVSLCGLAGRWRIPHVLASIGLVIVSFISVSFIYSQLPMLAIASYVPAINEKDIWSMLTMLAVLSIPLIVILWADPVRISKARFFFPVLAGTMILGFIMNPTWHKAYGLLTERTFMHRDAAEIISKSLPADAVVIGERAPQVLISTPISAMPIVNRDPMKDILAYHEKFPNQSLHALVAQGGDRHTADYMNNRDKVRLQPIAQMTLPNFGTGIPENVILVQLHFPK